LFAVGIGLVLAAVIYMKQSGDVAEAKTEATLLGDIKGRQPWTDEMDLPREMLERVYIKRLHGPLFFGFAFGFKDIVADMPDVDHVVIRMKNVPFIDQSGAYALEEALVDLKDKGITVVLTGLNEASRDRLTRMQIIPRLLPEEQDFERFEDCLVWIEKDISSSALKSKSTAELSA